MGENPISISNLNDFIFCPVSIFFHSLESETEKSLYQNEFQINGTAVHEKSDNAEYSTKKSILQAVPVYCEKYNIMGKIDIFDIEKETLIERKKTIKVIYDGYIFQLYAQYFALKEMGYSVKTIKLYSMAENKTFNIDTPENDSIMFKKFCETIDAINNFTFESFIQTNIAKCKNCIYEPLCSFSKLKE